MATAGALEDQELMSEGKNLSLQRCTSLKDLRAEENSERMIVSMSPKSYSDGCLNSTRSIRTAFLVGTAKYEDWRRADALLHVLKEAARSQF